MKNLIVKLSSFLVLAMILTVVSAKAQSTRIYRTHIPFDFTIGKNAYKAGDYIIKLENLYEGAAVLSVNDSKNRNLRQMPVLKNGSRSLVEKTVLMFDRYENRYILTQMVSPDFGLSVRKSKAKNLLAKKMGQPDEIVAVLAETVAGI